MRSCSVLRQLIYCGFLAAPSCGPGEEGTDTARSFHEDDGTDDVDQYEECRPIDVGSQLGELIAPFTPFPQREPIGAEEAGCESAHPGHVQFIWEAPHDGCFAISTVGPDTMPIRSTTKVADGSCDGPVLMCLGPNYGAGMTLCLLRGDRIVVSLTAHEPTKSKTYALTIRTDGFRDGQW